MSGLGHYLESEGIATVSISLVREHSERMLAPRALWVPFPLGRPFGVPNDAQFQRSVLLAALALLERTDGPVLEDFPHEAPAETDTDMSGWVCPVAFMRDDGTPDSLEQEVAHLAPWYALSRDHRARTTVGLAGIPVVEAARFLKAMADGAAPQFPVAGVAAVDAIRWSADDLKAYYMEAATARPGVATQSELEAWLWSETQAGAMLSALARRCLGSADADIRDVGDFMLVPPQYRN